jgi:hypothetical protein
MSISAAEMLELIRDLVARPVENRDLAADRVVDWIRTFDDGQAAIVAQVLAWLVSVETNEASIEAQLHALAELAEHDRLPPAVLAQVRELSAADLRGSSVEHYEYLRSLDSTPK